jgi:tetratricopeptide (TPR) repeat protein
LGRPADAERYALRAREVSSTPDPCWILGRVRQQQGDEDGAKRYWEEAVARDPQHNAALRELGRLALLQQQPEQALAWLLRAREAKPDDTATAQALAATYRHLGQEEAAVEVLKAIPSSAQGEGPSTPVGPTGVPRR